VEAADAYFSIDTLVHPGVACLGGPNFKRALVKPRLMEAGINVTDADWCTMPETDKVGETECALFSCSSSYIKAT
jgi:hypothetical protein